MKEVCLVTICSNCGEQIRLVLTKKECKILYKGFQLTELKATESAEIQLNKLSEVSNLVKA